MSGCMAVEHSARTSQLSSIWWHGGEDEGLSARLEIPQVWSELREGAT
jgi:hypothetical protein